MKTLSSRDPNQIVQYTHDEQLNAQRVSIVGGDFGLAEAIKDGLKDLKIELNSSSKEPFIVEKEVVVKEPFIVSIPQIIKEQEIKVIETEKYIPFTEIKFIEIEKPIYIKETEIKEVKNVDKLIKILFVTQTLTLLLILLKTFI